MKKKSPKKKALEETPNNLDNIQDNVDRFIEARELQNKALEKIAKVYLNSKKTK